jgi:ribosomal protein S12 methylthiotransferase
LPEADAILGLDERDRVVETCDRILGRTSPGYPCLDRRQRMTPWYMAYLRIADGCDNHCAYCTIPMIRGEYRSEPMEKLLAEAECLADQGVQELNIIAQDTTRYGWDLYGMSRLPELLERLCAIEGFRWIRLLYTHPAHLTEEVIEVLAGNPRICRYLDLPIQHISDALLRRMNRRVTGRQIRRWIHRLRERVPGMAIRTSLIVGLPGETDEEFEELLEFVAETRFERLGAFIYSQEEGTPAALLDDQVPEEVRQERLDRLMTLQGDISLRINRGRIGQRVEVLVEGSDEEGLAQWVGRTEWDAPEIDGRVLIRQGDASVGAFVGVEITDVDEYDVYGTIRTEHPSDLPR